MTAPVATGWAETATGERCFTLALAAPRANALEPGLLAALHAGLDALERSGARLALLSGGRNFSSGGDVARFAEAAARGEARAYAETLVPLLQDALLRMIALPVLFGVAARGAVTGGSAGFLFAADLAVLAPGAFVQPWYSRVGFAPDGGWTALLPERVGAGAALRWLLADDRLDAGGALARGLADAVDPEPEARALALLGEGDTGARLAAKALVWDGPRRAETARRLAAETSAFLDRIGRPEVRAGMARYLDGRKEGQG